MNRKEKDNQPEYGIYEKHNGRAFECENFKIKYFDRDQGHRLPFINPR